MESHYQPIENCGNCNAATLCCMAGRFQFSVGALLRTTAAVATLIWLAKIIGPGNVSLTVGFTLPVAMVIRWPTTGFVVGVLFIWAIVLAGTYLEVACDLRFNRDSKSDRDFLAHWRLFGWLVAGAYLTPIYLARLVCGYWWRLAEPRRGLGDS